MDQDEEYHCMVLVDLEHLADYGCWSHQDMTDKGLDEGNWVVIGPQYTIDRQDADWIGELSLVAASPVGLIPNTI